MGASSMGGTGRGLTAHEAFTRTFDVFPFEQPAFAGTGGSTTQQLGASFPRRSGSTTGSVYGFGSASLRFQNEVYGSHLAYGKVNKAVIELSDNEPVAVTQLAQVAPSRELPDYAANFKPESGKTYATTISRDAPPGTDGQPRFWVQPKDTVGLFPDGNDVPAPFVMNAPRGAGAARDIHMAPSQLLTPAERREALVFDKCQQRARKTLLKATQEACNLTYTMQQRFPHGVMGLEGPNCPESLIYRNQRLAIEAKAAKHDKIAFERHENIASKRDTQLDYQLLTHDHRTTAEDKMFTKKAPSALGIRGDPTISDPTASYGMRPQATTFKEFGFRSNQEHPLREPQPERTQRLHNVNTRGKPYDIISGVALPVRPTAADTTLYEHDRRAHPSNVAVPHTGEMAASRRGFTAPTLIGPVPDAHQSSWQPPSPTRGGSTSKSYMR